MRLLIRFTPLAVFLALAFAACAGADSDDLEREDCARLRDHVVDLRLSAADAAGNLSPADRAQHRTALTAAAGDGYVDECSKTHSPRQVACLLAASSLDALSACKTLPAPEEN